ncbi:S8 family serine peptidase [Streptomyces sp. NPDC088157]|uniref:S8 family serine peptidase n=1 Tax=Streptomyces sp. NPDC088157 TaxID=3365832 RepID=UPI00382DAE27
MTRRTTNPRTAASASSSHATSSAISSSTRSAATELDHVPTADDFAGYRTVAPPGLLSPHSRTSVMFRDAAAMKPDIVMEGGNLLVDADVTRVDGHDALSLTTTARSHHGQLLTTIDATSAATAQAARLAALAYARYPNLRAETVRGLLVHEAQWTDAMINGVYNRNGRRKIAAGQLARTVLRRYGWGVPSQERVLSGTASAVTMIIQGSLKPFARDGKSVRLGELKLHELPWPREQLLDLDAEASGPSMLTGTGSSVPRIATEGACMPTSGEALPGSWPTAASLPSIPPVAGGSTTTAPTASAGASPTA